MTRIAAALILIPIVTWTILKGPYALFAGLLVVVGLLAYYELDSIGAAQSFPKAGIPGMIAGLLLLLTPEPLLVLVFTAIAALLLSLRGNPKDALPAAGLFVLGVVYIFGSLRTAIELRAINPHWLMIAVLVSWAGDTAAMYVGKAFGKHKLAPETSPSKTWEGAAASVAGGTIAAVVYAHYLIESAPWRAVAIGLAANIAGQMGDLCESALKRGGGVKDSGTTLPGHGGWLDRIDSSLFSVPVTYGVLRLLLQYT